MGRGSLKGAAIGGARGGGRCEPPATGAIVKRTAGARGSDESPKNGRCMKKMLEFYTNINPGLIQESMQPPLSCANRTGQFLFFFDKILHVLFEKC